MHIVYNIGTMSTARHASLSKTILNLSGNIYLFIFAHTFGWVVYYYRKQIS